MADAVNVQHQVKQNNEELQDFLKDLYKWEDEVQAKDKLLVSSKTVDSSHPVRNKPQKKKPKSILKHPTSNEKSRLKGSDFKAWDNYDVEKALQEIDEEEEQETLSTSDDSEDEEVLEHRRLQQALYEKEKGNDLFKEGKYEAAINRYTTAIMLDPHNAILPANRAMALIKVQRYGAAIQDCDTALELDNTYMKAYARRATAKQCLGRLQEALQDYEQLLALQPGNKQGLEGIEKVTKLLAKKSKDHTSIKNERQESRKPMKRYLIEEIGSASSDDEKQEVDESCRTTTLPNKSDFIQTLNHLHLPNQAPVSHNTSLPVKTVGENTEYTSTIEDHNHLTKPACNDDNDLQKLSKHESSKPSQLATTTGSSCLSMTTSSSTAPNGQKCNLFPPLTSIQFQSTWKRLEKNRELQYSYLKMIKPEQLPKIMGESVESSLLVQIFSILRDFYVRDCHPVFDELKYIAQVKRFSMALMFFSTTEKLVINELFYYLGKMADNEKTFSENELHALKKQYELR